MEPEKKKERNYITKTIYQIGSIAFDTRELAEMFLEDSTTPIAAPIVEIYYVMRQGETLKRGDVVQLSPENTGNPMFGACMMTVTEPKSWGAQGYVQGLGENGKPGGRAYYRAKWDSIGFVGHAHWIAGGDEEDEKEI